MASAGTSRQQQVASSRTGVYAASSVLVLLLVAGWVSWKQGLLQGLLQFNKVFTAEELSKYNGDDGAAMYLAIMGEVYDVSEGAKYYGPGTGYNGFLGRDASRSFVTGDFEGDLNDQVEDFDAQQCASLLHWRKFYREHKTYSYKGRFHGAFYDAHGQPTAALGRVEKLALQAKTAEQLALEEEAKYPGCNSRWNEASGGWVWCDNGMYPRKIFSVVQTKDGQPKTRCACFSDIGWSDVRQVYPHCAPEATECMVSPPKGQSMLSEDFLEDEEEGDSHQHAEDVKQEL